MKKILRLSKEKRWLVTGQRIWPGSVWAIMSLSLGPIYCEMSILYSKYKNGTQKE